MRRPTPRPFESVARGGDIDYRNLGTNRPAGSILLGRADEIRRRAAQGKTMEARTCQYPPCGKLFMCYVHLSQKTCSKSCGRSLSAGSARETRACPICDQSFITLKSSNKRCCTRRCAARWRERQRNQSHDTDHRIHPDE